MCNNSNKCSNSAITGVHVCRRIMNAIAGKARAFAERSCLQETWTLWRTRLLTKRLDRAHTAIADNYRRLKLKQRVFLGWKSYSLVYRCAIEFLLTGLRGLSLCRFCRCGNETSDRAFLKIVTVISS